MPHNDKEAQKKFKFFETLGVTLGSMPKATNKLGAVQLYAERENYKLTAYPEYIGITPRDMWRKDLYYGKVDYDGAFVLPSEDSLKPLEGSTNETFLLVNFVADAFEDFKNYFGEAFLRAPSLAQQSIFKNIKVKKAWFSLTNEYHGLVNNVYSFFTNDFLKINNKHADIKNFKDFFHIFFDFLKGYIVDFPFTKTGFVSSAFTSPLASGLIVELADQSHSKDEPKVTKWLHDPNYRFYAQTAQDFGFKIDKNAPWRLIADIKSPPMRSYMARYGVAPEDLFESDYFYQTHLIDIPTLQVYFYTFYNSYVQAYPFAKKPVVCSGKTKNKTIVRKALTEEQFADMISVRKWYELYVMLRAMETKKDWNEQKIKKIVDKAHAMFKIQGVIQAQEYLDTHFRPKHLRRGDSDISDTRR